MKREYIGTKSQSVGANSSTWASAVPSLLKVRSNPAKVRYFSLIAFAAAEEQPTKELKLEVESTRNSSA